MYQLLQFNNSLHFVNANLCIYALFTLFTSSLYFYIKFVLHYSQRNFAKCKPFSSAEALWLDVNIVD